MLLDCGATSLSALRRCGLDPGEVAAVFVSHLHGDHFGGIPFLILNAQFARRAEPLTVIGPPGIARRLAGADGVHVPRFRHGGAAVPVEVIEAGARREFAAAAGVRAAGFAADHPSGPDGPALALRLAIGGKVIGYTGDTAWTDALIDVAAGADLLIAEAYYRDKNVPYHLRHADLARTGPAGQPPHRAHPHVSRHAGPPRRRPGSRPPADGLVLRI